MREVEAREHKQGVGVGLELEGLLGLIAGVGGAAAAFSDLGEAGVGSGAAWVRSEGELELLLSLKQQALGEILAAEIGVLGRAFCGGKRGHARGAELVELEGGLTEAGLGVDAADALERAEGGVGVSGEFGAGRSDGDLSAKFAGLIIVGLELEGSVGLLEGSGGVAAAVEGDGEVVVIVLVGRVNGGGLLEESGRIFALAGESDGLVVDDFGQRKAVGYELERCGSGSVVGGVEAGEADVEVGLERLRVGGGYLGERGGGVIEVAGGVLLFAEGEQGVDVAGGEGGGVLEALEGLSGGGGVDAADVVLEGWERDRAAGGEEGLLGYVEVGIEDAGDLPGDGVLGVVEVVELGSVLNGRREAELVNGEHLGLDGEVVVGDLVVGVGLDGVAADDDVVGIKLLGDADGGRARGTEVGGQTEMGEREDAVVVGDGEEAGGVEALVERVGEGVADPVEGGIARAIFKGEDEDEAAAGGGLGGEERWRQRCCDQEKRVQETRSEAANDHRC